ncbi:Uncharacterised nucleotidyltransferase [Microbacterium sp. ru370.1]|uniref:nucleotidyltransferase family protein n=1 Tax=unclassified Microbacterium TaxID=2609290 RepID=UPI00088340DA|nr:MULTISPECIES: nucleotidyltransferase family protein [unclassified Microbacterium]SDP06222.1 Uncharacterised nucleotidyltransferase [Microbacterium sp. ru370.1]SIT93735.1 Uncharacterised nucleotidyltransferase [Microbacterium sp. RU1D]
MRPSDPPVAEWIPIAAGALDVRDSASFAPEAEILVAPAEPGEAVCLIGEAAALWRRLVAAPRLPESAFDDDQNALLDDLRAAGLVALGPAHPAAVTTLRPPVLSSALHELVYAVVARVAAAHGIRCVFIKGPTLHHQGLRDREHSGDVDVWCDPPRIDDLATALEEWGWRRAADPWRGTTIQHTVTMAPGSWGCEVDVHRRLPGLVLDDSAAFEEVLRDAQTVRYGAVELLVPAPSTHAVLAALHTVRPVIGAGPRTTGHSAEAQRLLRAVGGTVERARALGAVPALRAELEPLAAPGTLDADATGTPRDWLWRSEPNHARAYWAAMREVPWSVRVRLVRRFVWPPDDVALASARQAGEPASSPTRARWARLRRGVRDWVATRR